MCVCVYTYKSSYQIILRLKLQISIPIPGHRKGVTETNHYLTQRNNDKDRKFFQKCFILCISLFYILQHYLYKMRYLGEGAPVHINLCIYTEPKGAVCLYNLVQETELHAMKFFICGIMLVLKKFQVLECLGIWIFGLEMLNLDVH